METSSLIHRESVSINNNPTYTSFIIADINHSASNSTEVSGSNLANDILSNKSDTMSSVHTSLTTNHTIYVIYFLVGVSMLLPWNVFITASEFFTYQFHDSKYQDTFQNYFSFASCFAGLVGLLYALATQKKSSLYSRSLRWLGIITFSFIVMVLSIPIPFGPYGNFWISIILLIVGSFACSVLSSDVLALAASMDSIYVQSTLAGQSLAGLAVAVAQFSILYLGNAASGSSKIPTSADHNQVLQSQGLWYFGCALITSIVALGSFWYLPRHPLYSYSRFITDDELDDIHAQSSPEKLFDRWWLIQKLAKEQPKMIQYMILDFLITLSVFPGLTSYVRSTYSSGFTATYFVSLGFIIFNLGDLLGRYIPTLSGIVIASPQGLGILSYGRLALIPIVLLSNLDLGPNVVAAFPPWLAGDGLFFLTMGTLAVTNGYLGTVLMMAAPVNTHHLRDRGMMASVMALTMSVGLILGSLASFPFRAIACACNPF